MHIQIKVEKMKIKFLHSLTFEDLCFLNCVCVLLSFTDNKSCKSFSRKFSSNKANNCLLSQWTEIKEKDGIWHFCCSCSLLTFGSFFLPHFPELHAFNRFLYQIVDSVNIVLYSHYISRSPATLIFHCYPFSIIF